MRALIQRAQHGRVEIDGDIVGQIDSGLVVLLGVAPNDTTKEAEQLVQKIVHLRIFADEGGKMNRSLLDAQAGVLLVSQFTLFADCRRGRRPSFVGAAPPQQASQLCDDVAERFRQAGISHVATGRFGADMQVSLCNDGPVTIMLDTDHLKR